MTAAAAETTDAPARAPRRDGLSVRARRDARALAEALWSPDGVAPPPEERLVWFTDDLSDFAGHLDTRARLLLRACLATATWIGPLLLGRLAHLGALPIAERIRAIHALEATPAGLALFAVKAIVSLVWWEHPDNAREIGWDRRCKRTR